MWETCVRSLGWEDSLEEGMATYSSVLPWRIPMDRGAWWATVHGVGKSQTRLSDFTFFVYIYIYTHSVLSTILKKESEKREGRKEERKEGREGGREGGNLQPVF